MDKVFQVDALRIYSEDQQRTAYSDSMEQTSWPIPAAPSGESPSNPNLQTVLIVVLLTKILYYMVI